LITATPNEGKELVGMRYRRTYLDGTESSLILIPFEDDMGTMYVENDFIGVYTVYASFIDAELEDPIVLINQEVWYGSVTSGFTTYNNCAIVYVRIQLPTGADYSNMKLTLILTRNQVWAADKVKQYPINLTAGDFDASGYYTAGIAVRRRDLDDADGVTADGYIMNATFTYTDNAVNKSVSAPQGVEFACGKQSLTALESEIDVEDFDDGENVIVNLNDEIVSSGIHRAAIKWSSSDTSVASVDANGRVTVLKRGESVTITATVCGMSAQITLNVMGMNFNGDVLENIILDVGDTSSALTPNIINLNGYSLKSGTTYSYDIESTDIATVNNSTGSSVTVTGVASGMTYLTVSATLIKNKAEKELSVKVPVYIRDTSITTVSASPACIEAGDTSTLTVTSGNASVTRWTWSIILGAEYLSNSFSGQNTSSITVTGRATGTAVVAAVGYNSSDEAIAAATQEVYIVDYKLNAYETGLINSGYIPITQNGGIVSVGKYGASTPTDIQSVPFVSSATVSPNGNPNTDGIRWFDYGGWYGYKESYVMLEDITLGSTGVPLTSTVLPYEFNGILDGAGHKLTVHSKDIAGASGVSPAGAIFSTVKANAYSSAATIRNIKVAGTLTYSTNSTKNAGFVAGTLESTATFENVYVNVAINDGCTTEVHAYVSALARNSSATINNVIINMENSTAGMWYVNALPLGAANTPVASYKDNVSNLAIVGTSTGGYVGITDWARDNGTQVIDVDVSWETAGLIYKHPWGVASDTWTTNYTSVWNWNVIFNIA